jgi:hypothetical protein
MHTRRLAPTLRRGRTLAVSFLIAIAAAACGRATGGSAGGTPSPGQPNHPAGPTDLVLRVQSEGGFVAPQALLLRYPMFSLYGDGTVVTEGAQIAIYPQPALPPLIATRVTAAGVQAILHAARAAGLYGPSANYRGAIMPDSAETVFKLIEGGRTHTFRVSGLGANGSDIPAHELAPRRGFETLLTKLTDLRSWLPAGSVGKDQPYRPSAMRVFVTPGTPKGSGGSMHEPSVAWPLADSLAMFGTPISTPLQGGPGRCGVVKGEDLAKVLPLAQRANQLTPWTSDGKIYGLSFRPLLPDESGC